MGNRLLIIVMAVFLFVSCGAESFKTSQSVDRRQQTNQEKAVSQEQNLPSGSSVLIDADRNVIDAIKLFDGMESVKPETKTISVKPLAYLNREGLGNGTLEPVRKTKDGYLFCGTYSGGFATTISYSTLLDRYNRFSQIATDSCFDLEGRHENKLIEDWIVIAGKEGIRATDITTGKMVVKVLYANPNNNIPRFTLKNNTLFVLYETVIDRYDLRQDGKKVYSLNIQKACKETLGDYTDKCMEADSEGNLELIVNIVGSSKKCYFKIDQSGSVVASRTISDVGNFIGFGAQCLCFVNREDDKLVVFDKNNDRDKYEISGGNISSETRFMKFIGEKLIFDKLLFDLTGKNAYKVDADRIETIGDSLYFAKDKSLFCLDLNTMKPVWRMNFDEKISLLKSLNRDYSFVLGDNAIFAVSKDGRKIYKIGDTGRNTFLRDSVGSVIQKNLDVYNYSNTQNAAFLDTDNNYAMISMSSTGFFMYGQPEKNSLSIYPSNIVHEGVNRPTPGYKRKNPVLTMVWNGDSAQTVTIDYEPGKFKSQTVTLEPGKPTNVTVEVSSKVTITAGDKTYDIQVEFQKGGD